jgi:hypothetical protein
MTTSRIRLEHNTDGIATEQECQAFIDEHGFRLHRRVADTYNKDNRIFAVRAQDDGRFIRQLVDRSLLTVSPY